jgi:threonine aldolase
MNFSSENFDGVHPGILKALINSNHGFVPSYGEDEYTAKARKLFKELFETEELEVFFCFNGTGANNFALSSIAEKHTAILCSAVSHLYTAESTAPETFTGCRLYPVKTSNGKIQMEDFTAKVKTRNAVHLPPASVLTISQPTEYGTIYSMDELKLIADHCHENNILLHIDGARIFNALVAMNCTFSEFINASRADVLTMGGTKSGLLFGEAVIFFNRQKWKHLKFNHKRSMQLASKNRFIAAQFIELFNDDLWEKIAAHTNSLARYFEKGLGKISESKPVYPVETNMVFMKMGDKQFDTLRSMADFYRWDDALKEVRFAFSFSNTEKEIDKFLGLYKDTIG